MNNCYESKDKQVVPFLLIQPEVKFLGTRLDGLTIYFQFSPGQRCQELAYAFASRKAPLVQPKDLLDAVETFRDIVFEMKEKKKHNGGVY